MGFECRYIKTHTKENLSKISSITFTIWPFHKKKKYSNQKAILSILECTTLNSLCQYQRYPNEGSWFKCDTDFLLKK